MKTINPRGVKKSRIEESTLLRGSAENRSQSWTDTIIALAIFALAFMVRLIYLFQIESIPLFYNLPGDPRTYDEWAQRIAAGDWLGHGVFYQAPLYPYFLALLQLILGHDLWSIRVAQITLGAFSCGLLYWVGSSLFSRSAGVAAGLILSLYAPAIFFDGLIEKTILDLFFIALLLFFLTRNQLEPHWARWVAIGAVLGLLGLSRENALILAFVVPIWIWLYFAERQPRLRLGWVALFALGLALVLFPVGLRNLWVGGEFALTTSQLGPNFFIGNNALADGTYASIRVAHGEPQFEQKEATKLAEEALGRSLTPREVSSYWLRRSLNYIRSEPMSWIKLMGKKWLIVWNTREIEDSDDFYIYQRWSWLLTMLGWTNYFGMLAPLAAAGFVLTLTQWRRLWLFYAMLLALTFSVSLFYVFGRYRFSIVPMLAVLAGAGLVEGFHLWKARKMRPLLECAGVLLLAALVVHWPVVGKAAPSAEGYNNLANALAKQGRVDQAIENYQSALKEEPTYGVAHFNLGSLYGIAGRLDEASYHLQQAIRIYPRYADAHSNLGNVLSARGDLDGAVQEFRRALELDPEKSEVHFNLGNALLRKGHLDEAVAHFRKSLEISPAFAQAHHNLGRAIAAQGNLNEAIAQFRQALRLQPEFAEAHESLGRALALQGKKDEAVRHYQEALRILKASGGRAAR